MIARITLEMALRKEFDYLIPAEFADRVQVGSRVKVPFGPRQVLGVVTGMIEESTHANLRPILKDRAKVRVCGFLDHPRNDAQHLPGTERHFHAAANLDAIGELRRDQVVELLA